MPRALFGWAIALGLLSAPVRADDTFAGVGAGSLMFQHADRITMQREDLTLSPSQVHVRYEMRNDRGAPFTGHVVFPFPVVDFARLAATPRNMVYGTDLEFLHFELTVDGQKVTPAMRLWATVPGRDVTALLRAQGIDLQHLPNQPPAIADPAPAQRRALLAGGAIDRTGRPLWQLHIAYEWDQVFQPGVTVIEHRYRPLAGATLAQRYADMEPPVFDGHRVCANPEKAAARALLDALHSADRDGVLILGDVSFILRTARNWTGPIGTFHLTLETRAPDEIAWACLPGMRLIRTGPTQYQGSAERWVANGDAEAVFMSRRAWDQP